MNTVELLPSDNAICFANPASAGPAGFAEFAGASPGIKEMRVVFGVQFETPRHVSRTNTCRSPLFGAAVCACVPFLVWLSALGVTARNATNLPELLIDGKMPSVPASLPSSSFETSVVPGLQSTVAPMHVSRRYTCRPAGAVLTRFVAAELNATYRPSSVSTALWLSPLPIGPSVETDTVRVDARQSLPAPKHVSRRNICEFPPCTDAYAT